MEGISSERAEALKSQLEEAGASVEIRYLQRAKAGKDVGVSVVLEDFGDNKISVIKIVRAITSLGLMEAKDPVESAPVKILQDMPRAEAKVLKSDLEAVGARVAIR